jgi:hypothetical protein
MHTNMWSDIVHKYCSNDNDIVYQHFHRSIFFCLWEFASSIYHSRSILWNPIYISVNVIDIFDCCKRVLIWLRICYGVFLIWVVQRIQFFKRGCRYSFEWMRLMCVLYYVNGRMGNARGEYDTRGWINFHISWTMHVLLFRMKPRKHIHVKYCWQTYFKRLMCVLYYVNGRMSINETPCMECPWFKMTMDLSTPETELHAGEGNMKIYSLKSIIFPQGNARGEYDTRGWINFHISWTMHVLLYRMKPRKHIHVKYCWQTYFKSIGKLSQTFKNHIRKVREICFIILIIIPHILITINRLIWLDNG